MIPATAKSLSWAFRGLATRSNLSSPFTASKLSIYGVSERLFSSVKEPGSSPSPPTNLSPDNFYDEKTETEREFEDIASSIILNGGVRNLTTIKEKVSLNELSQPLSSRIASSSSGGSANPAIPRYLQYLHTKEMGKNINSDLGSNSDKRNSRGGSSNNSKGYNNSREQAMAAAAAADEHSPMFDEVNAGAVGDNVEDKSATPHPLQNFMSDKDSSKFNSSNQGLRHCPGQRQRRGVTGRLYCHKIDLDSLDKLDVVNLRRFMTEDGEILGKKHTGLCSKCQRKVAVAVKQARHIGVLPHLGQFVIFDSKSDDMIFNNNSPSPAK